MKGTYSPLTRSRNIEWEIQSWQGTWVWLEISRLVGQQWRKRKWLRFFTWIWQSFSTAHCNPLNSLNPTIYWSIFPTIHPSLLSSFCSSLYLLLLSIHPSFHSCIHPSVQIYWQIIRVTITIWKYLRLNLILMLTQEVLKLTNRIKAIFNEFYYNA